MLRRRTFLGALGAIGATSQLGCERDAPEPSAAPSAPAVAPPEPAPTPALRHLSEVQAAALSAMLCRIWPSRDGVPGARETGVLAYVDGQLGERAFQGFRRLISDGLDGLDAWSRTRHQRPFAELDAARQDALLADVQRGQVPGRFPAARFFAVVHSFALEGHLGDPQHGGNHARRAWDWIGHAPQCGSATHQNCGG